MFDKFSEESIKVIMLAQEEARLLKHPYVGCDHLLLGLFAIGQGKAHNCLSSNEVNLAILRAAVVKHNKKGKKTSPKELPFDADAKTALECAFRECLHAKQACICSEHILLGLLALPRREGTSASIVLDELGVDRHELRQKLWLWILAEARVDGKSNQDAMLLMSQCPEVLMIATAEAYKLQRTEIESDLILLGILKAGGRVIRLLEDFKVTYEYARSQIEKIPGAGTMIAVSVQFSESAAKLIQHARDEAALLGHASLDARHILLGFTHEQEGIAWQIFKEKNVDIEALRAAVLALFEESK